MLAGLAGEVGAAALHYTPTLEPGDPGAPELQRAMGRNGAHLRVVAHRPNLLFDEVRRRDGGPYLVFTAFWRACLDLGEPPAPEPVSARMAGPRRWPGGMALREILADTGRSWTAGFAPEGEPGEAGAQARLARFLASSLADYHVRRDVPAADGTSRLSPHLHFGEISARAVWQAAAQTAPFREPGELSGPGSFLRQLAWREFAHHLLVHHPETPEQPLRKEFALFPWQADEGDLAAWRSGLTGYPLVDAGMRQLWTTGWMHNRVRLVCASFLVKHLLQPWQSGARWFWDTLLDADLADNTLGWQWVAGCGADAAPYFRIFNPILQGVRWDPHGDYVRRWLPELTDLPDACAHAPWTATADARERAGLHLVGQPEVTAHRADGHDVGPLGDGLYPEPIIEHAAGRARALAALAAMRDRAT